MGQTKKIDEYYTEPVTVYFTKTQKEIVVKKAKENKTTVSRFIRSMALFSE